MYYRNTQSKGSDGMLFITEKHPDALCLVLIIDVHCSVVAINRSEAA